MGEGDPAGPGVEAASDAAPSGDRAGPDLVFVGGTGRSGTHVVARLLGHHTRFEDVPIECRFHCNRSGFGDLLEGRVALRGFVRKLREFWWRRTRVDGQDRGLYKIVPEDRFEAAVERFAPAYEDDPVAACRALFYELLWPIAERAGKPGLVEMSSHNIRSAHTLRRLFEEARFVHALRDGRDAAASVTTKTWGPRTLLGGIEWWADRLRAIEAGVRGEEDGAPYSVPADRLHVVMLDELVSERREQAYGELLGFLGVSDERAAHRYLEQEMTPENASRDRWREGLGRFARRRVQFRYERTLQALSREGNHAAPKLIEAYERSG